MAKKLLFVSDRPEELSSLLTPYEAGSEVLKAKNGRQALMLFMAERPQVVICDESLKEFPYANDLAGMINREVPNAIVLFVNRNHKLD